MSAKKTSMFPKGEVLGDVGGTGNSKNDGMFPKGTVLGNISQEIVNTDKIVASDIKQMFANIKEHQVYNYSKRADGTYVIPESDPLLQKVKNQSQNVEVNNTRFNTAIQTMRKNAENELRNYEQRRRMGEKFTTEDLMEMVRLEQIVKMRGDSNVPEVPYENPKNKSQVYLNNQAIQANLDTKLYTAILNSDSFGYYYNKGINASENSVKDKGVFNKIKNSEDKYQYMEEVDKQLYYYFVGKGNAEELQKYIRDISPILENRQAEHEAKDNGMFENISTAVVSGITSSFMDMARAGVNTSYANGMINSDFLANVLEPTYYEKLFTEVQKNSKNRSAVENLFINAANSIAYQIPTLALGASGGYGTYVVSMATQNIGSSTTEAINQGYDVIRGVMHGLVDTATELTIEKLLGGIGTKISGGYSSPLLKKALNAVDNVFSNKKIANLFSKGVSLAFSANSEGVEEFVQAFLSPVVRNIVYGENNKITEKTFYDAVQGYLIGSICGFAMDVGYTGAGKKLAQTKLEILGEDLNKYVGAESLLKFAENVENNSETYYEVKGKFETGKEIDNMLLATLYNESAKAFENPSAEIVKAVSSKDINNLIKLAEKYAENKHKTAGNVKTDAANINAQTTATPVNANVDEIAVSLENGGEYKGYKITDTYFSSITSSTRFELTKPNGEKLEGWSNWDSKGDAKELYNDAAIMIAEDLAQPTVNTQNSTLQEGETKDTSTASVDSSTDISTDSSGAVNQGGNVTTFGGIDTENGKHLDKAQQDEIKGIGNKLGREVIFEDFHKLEKFKNKEKVPDGYIDKDGKVHINFYAKKPVQFLLKHEITHYLKRKIDKFKYADFQNLVFGSEAFKTWMQSKGFASLTELKQDVYNRYSEVKNFDEPKAFEEILADFVGDYLFGGENEISQKFIDMLKPEQKKTFMEIIKDIIEHLKQKFKGDVTVETEIDKLENRFIELYNEAAGVKNKNNGDSETQYSFSSIANTFYGDENMTSFDFEKKDYKQTEGYKNYVEQCVDNMRQTRADFDEKTARQEIEKQIDGIVRVALAAKKAGYDIYDDASKRSKTDSKNRLLFSSLEPNSDYLTSSDISTECDKRKNFAEIYDAIVKKEQAMNVPEGKRFFDNIDNYFYLHKVLADKGLTQPCRECYVESMRKNLAPMANAFLRLVNETNENNKANDQLYHQEGKDKGKKKSNNAKLRNKVLKTLESHPEYNMTASDLTVEMLTTETGLAQLKIQAPLIYEAFNSFYGQSKPKMPKKATPFRFGELTALLTDNNGKINQRLVNRINSTGGFRLQSYSDFQIQNFVDVLQVIFEAGTLGLSGHAYTKVPAFLEATEGTNLKRNISIFMYKDNGEWKLDKNDSFPAETLEEIYDIVKSDKSGNTGIIAVSQNTDMSCWIMANNNIAYGIPFHKSGLKMDTVRDTDVKTDDGRVVKGYSETIDHTKYQTEVYASTETKVKKGIDIYKFWDFDNVENLSKNKLIEKNVKKYIDACEKAGYLPKFRNYVINNSAVLESVLNYSKKLGFVSQNATIKDIAFEYKGYTIPYGYYKFLGDFSMFTPDGKASSHETLSLANYDFDKAEEFFDDSESLRRNEILQQFANDGEREIYRKSNLNAEQLEKIIAVKRKEVVKSIVEKDSIVEDEDYSIPAKTDAEYLKAVEKGDMETAQMLVDEAAKDAGYDLKLYHGTKDFGFTEFSTDKSADEFSIFTSESLETAEDYSKVKGVRQISDASDNKSGNYVLYGKSENLLEVDAKGAEWNHISTPDVVNDVMFKMLGEMKTHDIAQYAKKNNYSGVKINNVKDGGTKASNVVVYFDSSSLKSADAITYDDSGKVIPLSERFNPDDEDIRYSIPATSNPEELLEAYENGDISRQEYLDTIKKKKTLNPKEITDLTKEDANTTPKLKKKEGVSTGNKTSKFYGSVLASSIFDPKFKAEVATDTFVEKYKSVTNKETLRKAAKELDEGGQSYVDKWKDKKPEHASLIDTAVGFILMDRYQRIGDYESAAKATEKVREFGTAGGQQVQIFSIIGRLTPSAMAAYAQLQLDKAFEIFKQNKTKEWLEKNKDKYKLTDDEIEFIRLHTLQAALFEEGTRQRAVFLGEIMALLQSKLPPEKGASIRAWQRIAMLLNLRTIQRNVVGNAGMVPIYIASDLFGTAIDKVAAKKTGTRTKGVWMPSSIKGMGKGFYESYDDFKRGIRTRMEDLNRFDVSISKGKNFNENSDGLFGKEILKNQLNAVAKVLNKIDNFTSFCLEAGDRPFFEMWFMNSLNKQMKLNNVDVPTAQMMETAKEEALERTWQDDNVYTRAVGKIKSGLNVIHLPKTNYGLGDVVIKFVKTPTNIAKAIYDFSPAGFASAAGNIRKLNNAIKTDNFTPELQRAVVRSLSNAITGTVIYTLIAVGASLGLVKMTGDDDEDKDVSNYEKYIMGTPPYSIEFFGTSITYDWMQPFGSILAMVAEYNDIVEENPDMGAGSKIWEVIKAGGSTLAKQSFVKSMEELFSGDNIAEGVSNVMLADPSAFIPQLSSQVASFFDEYRRTTYDSNSAFQTAINKVIAKIPGLREKLPKQVNSLGEDVKNTQYLDVWDAFMSPWNTYPKSSKEVVKDIYKLYKDSGDNSVMPRMAPNYIEKSGVRINFTTEEKNNFQRAMGDRSVQMLTILFGSKEYEKLKDEQKVAIVKKIYDYSYARAKSELKYDFKTLTAFMGKNKNGDPILTKEKYDRMSEENIRKMVEDIFLSNAEVKRLDDYEKLVNYWIDQAKK